MAGLEIAVLIGVVLLVGGVLAWKLALPAPLVLLVLGTGLGFVPALGGVALPPQVVLFLFLPALLYWEALTISTREARRNLRVILLSAIPLVLVTAAVVAVAGHLAALPWAVAIALGAIVAPTDATAVGPVSGALPRRTRTVLRAESLINDGTALTVYTIAVAAVARGRDVDFGVGALRFLGAYAGGVVIGVGVAVLVRTVTRLLDGRRLLQGGLSVLTPFLAYLPAEHVGASGVLAVVTCGVVLSHFGPRMLSARTRTQNRGFWELTSSLLNGTLFLLVGFQAHHVLVALGADPWPVLGLGLLVSALVIVARLAWVNTTPYLIRALDRRPVQRTMRVTARQRLVSGWAGFRGAVSLAAALALPDDARWHPYRDALIAVTLVVIVVTLVAQGLTLPAVIRFARLPTDPSEREEELLAERTMSETGAAMVDAVAAHLGTPDEVAAVVRRQYEDAHRGGGDAMRFSEGSEGALRRALIAKKREAVIRLRDEGRIDDAVLRRMQDRLDIEELRVSPVDADD